MAGILSVTLLSGCATTSAPPTLPHGESIAIRSAEIGRVDTSVDSKAKAAGKGAALGVVGAVGGVVLGGLGGAVVGMACGPLAIFCVPMAAAAGAGAGGVTIGAMGMAAGGRGGITGNKADAFNELASARIDQDEARTTLNDLFTQQAGQYWDVQGASKNNVIVRIESLHFEQPGNEQIRLVLRSEMDLIFGDQKRTLHLQEATPTRHVDYWIDANGANLAAELEQTVQAMAHAMVSRIAPGLPTTALARNSN